MGEWLGHWTCKSDGPRFKSSSLLFLGFVCSFLKFNSSAGLCN